jgi:putative DNA primase/helicase
MSARRAVNADLLELGIAYRAQGPAEQRVRCPRCDRGVRDDALGVNTETGVFHCFRCGWSGRAASGESRAASPVARLDDPERAERVRKRLREIWVACALLEHPAARPVRRYLEARGLAQVLAAPPANLRAHPALACYDTASKREVRHYPAMIAALTDHAGKICTLHATYLRADGCVKAPVPSPKKILGVPVPGATKGGAIRLYEPRDGRLGVAEGIENALSLGLIRQIPVWSSYCADNLRRVRLPHGLRVLEVGVDVDDSGKGEKEATALARRALRDGAALRARLIFPDGQGKRDLNDELRAKRTR